MEILSIKTSQRVELVDITRRVEQIIERQNIKEGICFLFVPHTTAGIIINENYDPSVKIDINKWLSQRIPEKGNYHHMEGNADAHIKATVVGNSLMIPITNSKLALGNWQGIFFAEFDGPRLRKVYLSIIRGGE